MQQTSQRQVSMLRNMIDESHKGHARTQIHTTDDMECDSACISLADKTFILLLHHLPGEHVTNQYTALYLHGWSFWYLDSFASHEEQAESSAKAEGPPVDIWLQAAADGVAMPAAAKQARGGGYSDS